MAEDWAANRDADIFDIAELDVLLPGFDEDPFNINLDFFSEPWISESGAHPHVVQNPDSAPLAFPDPESVVSGFPNNHPCFASSGESFDEAGVDHDDGACDFVSKVLVDCSNRENVVTMPLKAYEGEGRDGKRVRIPVVAGDEDDDPARKNFRRKMRNRESAMKSRERKKTYTKDLETKCKFLESECRRLDYLLRCCIMDNTILRQSLQFQKERLGNATMYKQESAALFVESLPLVSLFWLMSIVCLFLVPTLRFLSLKALSRRVRRDFAPMMLEVKGPPEIVEVKRPPLAAVKSSTGEKSRRRYKGFRSRIKQLFLFPLHAFLWW